MKQSEIKFRAFSNNSKRMMDWDFIKRTQSLSKFVQLNHIVLMQWVGLNDANGKPIYEGDIIDVHQTVNGQSKFLIHSCLPRLDIRYAFDHARKYEYDPYDLLDYFKDESEKECEVVGNIFEAAESNKP